MQVHEGAPDQLIFGGVAALALGEAVLARVHERARKTRPEVHVVRTPGPLEPFWVFTCVPLNKKTKQNKVHQKINAPSLHRCSWPLSNPEVDLFF